PPALFTLSLHDALPIWVGRLKLCGGKGLKEPIRLTDADDSGPAEICGRVRGHSPDPQFVRELRPAGGAGQLCTPVGVRPVQLDEDRKSTRLNSSHVAIS